MCVTHKHGNACYLLMKPTGCIFQCVETFFPAWLRFFIFQITRPLWILRTIPGFDCCKWELWGGNTLSMCPGTIFTDEKTRNECEVRSSGLTESYSALICLRGKLYAFQVRNSNLILLISEQIYSSSTNVEKATSRKSKCIVIKQIEYYPAFLKLFRSE